jgi:hypothetical protein
MHRAFTVREIVALIVSYIGSESKATLAALATTCSTLSDCALDELWRSVHLIFLARCMPAHLWDEIEAYHRYQAPDDGDFVCGNGPHGYYTRTLVSSSSAIDRCCTGSGLSQVLRSQHVRSGDWLGERFTRYARRVRYINTEGWDIEGDPHDDDDPITVLVDPTVINTWAEDAKEYSLFHGLTRAKWAFHENLDVKAIPLFANLWPNLESVIIGQHTCISLAYLVGITLLLPRLRSISLHLAFSPNETIPDTGSFVQRCLTSISLEYAVVGQYATIAHYLL